MKCPICGYEKPDNESFCSQCNFSTEIFLSDVSEECRARYEKKVGIARKNWKKMELQRRERRLGRSKNAIPEENKNDISSKKRFLSSKYPKNDPNGTMFFKGNDKQSSKIKSRTPAVPRFDTSMPIPPLKRDQFETLAEFRNRINQYPPVPIGHAVVRDGYNIRRKKFSINIHLDSWTSGAFGIKKKISPYIRMDRITAQRLHSQGGKFPVFARMSVSRKKIFLSDFHLVSKNDHFPVKGMTGFTEDEKICFPISVLIGGVLPAFILVFAEVLNPFAWIASCAAGAFLGSLLVALLAEWPSKRRYAALAFGTMGGIVAGPVSVLLLALLLHGFNVLSAFLLETIKRLLEIIAIIFIFICFAIYEISKKNK